MFKFDFDLDDAIDVQAQDGSVAEEVSRVAVIEHNLVPFTEVSLAQLLSALPPLISYSPLLVPISSGRVLILARRDLFDARFQLLAEDEVEEQNVDGSSSSTGPSSVLDYLNAPSDIVPGVYEGGLKTWECSLDLVGYLDNMEHRDTRGQRVLEIGCGTAVPSLYLLHEIFSTGDASRGETNIHLQDYNSSVLRLVTLPNIILAWYFSPSSDSYRANESFNSVHDDLSVSSPGELPITEDLTAAFISSLKTHGLILRFFSGSWNNFNIEHAGGKYDLVLSSETIYRTESLGPLIALMRGACGYGENDTATAEKNRLEVLPASELSTIDLSTSPCPPTYLCLVAAKVLYFGVGGGISDFVRTIEEPGSPRRGQVKTVWKWEVGVGRRIMQIEWVV